MQRAQERVETVVTKVLIVDDEAGIRESLADIFEDEGYEVATAAHGGFAMEALGDEALPCVVILDLLMPVMDGNQVYERMQGDPRLAGVPVIITTSDPSLAPSGLLIMKKPINLERLLATVDQICSCVS